MKQIAPLIAAIAFAALAGPAAAQPADPQLVAPNLDAALQKFRATWVDTNAVTTNPDALADLLSQWTDKPAWVDTFGVQGVAGKPGVALGIDVDKLPKFAVGDEALTNGVFADSENQIWVCATCIVPQNPLNVNIGVALPASASNVPGAIDWQCANCMLPMGTAGSGHNIVIGNVNANPLTVQVRFSVPGRGSIAFPHPGGTVSAGVSFDFTVLVPGASYEIRPSPAGDRWILVQR